MFRRVLTCAIGLGVLAGAAACSPVRMGAAATVGSQRITIAQLDNQVASFNQVYPKYAGQVQLTSAQVPAAVLSWLIRFRINDQIAQNAGLAVTDAEGKATLGSLQSNAAASGETLEQVMVANGIAPSMKDELGRYLAIDDALVRQSFGSKLPTTSQSAATAVLTHAQCVAAKSLSIAVNPQFGRMNYSNYTVVATPDLLSKASGASSSSSSSAGASPSC